MYITDLRHLLDARGAIGPTKGAAHAMAQSQTDLVAHASCVTGETPAAPKCFKCMYGPSAYCKPFSVT